MIELENSKPIELVLSQEKPAILSEIKIVKAMLVHPSSILPERSRGKEVKESVKRDGIIRPIIARPHPTKLLEYEIIDGHNCYFGLVENKTNAYEELIKIDVRYGLTDSDVFKLANTLHIIENRTTYDWAKFNHDWIQTKTKELGTEDGATTAIIKEMLTEEPNTPEYEKKLASKQTSFSQYKAIYSLIQELQNGCQYKGAIFDLNMIKSLPINKLLELAKLVDTPTEMLKVIKKLMNDPEMKIDELKELTKEYEDTIPPKKQQRLIISVKPDLKQKLHDALYKANIQAFDCSFLPDETLKQFMLELTKTVIDNIDSVEIELEKTKKGNKIVGVSIKRPSISKVK